MTNKHYIQQAFGINEDDYSKTVELSGYAWIDRYFHNDEEALRIISHCEMFWIWWVSQWNNREEKFISLTGIDLLDGPLEIRYRLIAFEEWVEVHDVKKMNIKPDQFVIRAISEMIYDEMNFIKTIEKNTTP